MLSKKFKLINDITKNLFWEIGDFFDDISERLGPVENQEDSIQNRFKAVEKRINEIKSMVNSLGVDNIREDINKLKQFCERMEKQNVLNRLDTLEKRYGRRVLTIDQHSSSLQAAFNRIENLESGLKREGTKPTEKGE